MWSFEHSVETPAGVEGIFEILSDTGRWSEWNGGVERIELDGPFETGTAGVMVLAGGDSLRFRLAWVGENQGFEDETPIPGEQALVRVRHALVPLPAGDTRITYRATVEGADAERVGPQIGPAVTADFPEVMAALAARAEAAAARA